MVTQRDPDMPFPSRSEYQRRLREAEAQEMLTGEQPVSSEAVVIGEPVTGSIPVPVRSSHAPLPQQPARTEPQQTTPAADREAEDAAFEAAARAVEEAHQREAAQSQEPVAPASESLAGDSGSFILEETRPYPPAMLKQSYSSIPRASHSAPPASVFWEDAPDEAEKEATSSRRTSADDNVPILESTSSSTPDDSVPIFVAAASSAPASPAEPAPAATDPAAIFESFDEKPTSVPSPSAPAETTGMRSRRLEGERAKAKKRRLWRRVRTVITLLLVLGLLSGAVWFAWNQIAGDATVEEADDYIGAGHGEVQVTVVQGESGTDIGNKLVEAGVVKSTTAFIRAFESNQASASIWPGTYTLRLEMSAADAVAGLLDEANRSDNTVTVIPGQTVNQVMKKIVEITEISEADVSAALADPKSVGLPDVAGGKVEGWLAPGSYEVSPDETAQSLLSQMITARVKQLDDLKVPEADRQTLLIKASILEREVNIDKYLPMVARVIENRLADPAGETVGKLQMDSTVLYGVGKTGGIPNAEDLANDNPYNTYLHPGLPAAPIAQPAIEAIEAMMKPADGPWLYFVTIDLDTGETRFAPTKAEHDANKALLDAYCEAQPAKCKQQ